MTCLTFIVGTRHKPRSYPFSSPSYILKNNSGKLEIAQELFGASEEDMAMVTDASFVDINNNILVFIKIACIYGFT